jgi:hypothetical protein
MICHSIRAVTLATAFAVSAFAAVPSADAASFDGPWSVVVTTRSGACDASYRYGVMIRGGNVSYVGGGPVSVSAAGQSAVGSGRLSNGRGGGTWRGQGGSGSCSGTWSATQG